MSVNEQQIRTELENLRKQVRSPAFLISKVFDGLLGGRANKLKEEIAGLENQLRLAESRRSSPRCLVCGAEGAKPLSFDDHGLSLEFVHECGGRLRLEPPDPDAPRFSYKPETVLLDQEGRRITS